jgi:uncharacterized protein (UPF0333 family)
MLRMILTWTAVIVVGYYLIKHGGQAGTFVHTTINGFKNFIDAATS